MAFSDDSVRAKLSALNETQDSIVSVAQWIMFYRRYADRTAQLWFDRLKESNTSKKLNLIYLANEIMQQAKSRRKEDFLIAFMPIVADATAAAYQGASQEVQNKIRRVVEVWRQRQVLEPGIQNATEARIDELDKNRSARPAGARLGGSLFGASSVPSELQPLTQIYADIAKADSSVKPLSDKADDDYAEQTKPGAPVPSAPVQAGRLSALMKTLATAEAAVSDGIKARHALVDALQKLLQSHTAKLDADEATRARVAQRRAEIETKRKDVEDLIFRRVSAEDAAASTSNGNGASTPDAAEPQDDGQAPEVEALTPPPPDVEQLSPPGSPPAGATALEADAHAADPIAELPPVALQASPPARVPGADLLSSLSLPGMVRAASAVDGANADPRKRRKMSHREAADLDEQMFGAGGGIELDADVAAGLEAV